MEKTHYKSAFSIAMFNYQRVCRWSYFWRLRFDSRTGQPGTLMIIDKELRPKRITAPDFSMEIDGELLVLVSHWLLQAAGSHSIEKRKRMQTHLALFENRRIPMLSTNSCLFVLELPTHLPILSFRYLQTSGFSMFLRPKPSLVGSICMFHRGGSNLWYLGHRRVAALHQRGLPVAAAEGCTGDSALVVIRHGFR